MATWGTSAWYRIEIKDGKVILDLFPREPGGATLPLPREEAEALARSLMEAVRRLKDDRR